MSPTPDVCLDDLPERYCPPLLRLSVVRPDCARAARLANARGQRVGSPYDVAFLATLVERAERQTPADPRRPASGPRPSPFDSAVAG